MGNNYIVLFQSVLKNNWRVFVLFLLSFLLYSNSITPNYNLDDELVTNSHPMTSQGVRAIPDIFRSYYVDNGQGITYGYRPVALTSFALEHELFGDNPLVNHLVNVVLYSLLVVLLFTFLSKLFVDKKYLTLSFVISLLFCFHPLHTEVVASIKNREEILALLFVILASIFTLKFYDKQKIGILILVLLFSVIAIFSKKSAIPGIMMIPAFLIIFRETEWRKFIPVVASFMLVLFFTVPIRDVSIDFVFIAALVAFYALLFFGKQGFDISLLSKYKWGLFQVSLGILFAYSVISYLSSAFLVTIIGALVLLSLEKGNQNLAFLLAFISWAFLGNSIVFAAESKAFVLLGLVALSFYLKKDHQKSTKIIISVLALLLIVLYVDNAPQLFNLLLLSTVLISIIFPLLRSSKIALYSLLGIILALGVFTLVDRGFDVILFVYLSIAGLMVLRKIRSESVAIRFQWIMFPVFLVIIFFSSEKFDDGWEWRYTQFTEQKMEDQGGVIRDIGRELEPSESVFVSNISTEERFATSVFILGKYLQLHIYPHPLRFYYGYAQVEKHSFSEVQVWIWLLVYVTLAMTAIYFLKTHPIYSFGVLFFLVSLAAFSNVFIPMAGMIGERLTFSASFGFCILLVYTIHTSFIKKNKWWSYVFGASIIAILSFWGIKTFSRNKNWKDKLTLYTHDIRYTSESAKMNQLVGSLYFDLSKEVNSPEYARKAISHFEKASAIYPSNFMYWFLQGMAYQYYGDYQSAIPGLTNALKLNAAFTDSYFNLAVCSQAVGDYQTAIDNYESYIELEPNNQNVYANLSFLYFQMGDLPNSISVNQNAINRFPNSPDAYINLGKTYLMAGDTTNAVFNLEKGALLDPGNKGLFSNLSNLFYKLNDQEKAAYYQKKSRN